MTFKPLPHLKLVRYSANQQEILLSFMEKVFELSCKCQYNGLYNANALLPDLVGTYFDRNFVEQVYSDLLSNKEEV